MPELVFLTDASPLVVRAARWLRTQQSGDLPDFSRTLVIVPTSGAARRLGDQLLTECAGRLLSPSFAQPIAALDRSCSRPVASPQECLDAWAVSLRRRSDLAAALLPGFAPDLRVRDSLRVAHSLKDVCALLAEAGLTPRDDKVAAFLPQDEERWGLLSELYQDYVGELEARGVADPNELRIEATASGPVPAGLDRVVVAGVADLNGLVRRYLSRLEAAGLRVTVLVDAVDCEDAEFDAWGCPDEGHWSTRLLPVPLDQITVAADAYSQAEITADLFAAGGDVALCLAEEDAGTSLKSALARRGLPSFDPQGESLAVREVAVLVFGWLQFCESGLVNDLRITLECPAFLRGLARAVESVSSAILQMYDDLIQKGLPETWSDAVALLRGGGPMKGAALVRELENQRSLFLSRPLGEAIDAFLIWVYEGKSLTADESEAASLRAFGAAMDTIFGTPSLGQDPETLRELLREAVAGQRLYERHEPDAVELNGWLEAPWLREPHVVLAGCSEGSLPASTNGHPFLPDGARKTLGLATNASRLARDAFLLHNLLASRGPQSVRLIYGRETAGGEPAKPSRLLFRCPATELPRRIRHLMREVTTRRQSEAQRWSWPLEVVQIQPRDRISVTGFGDYLACPMRYYFKHVLRLDSVDPRPAEMDARQYGTILHKVVEIFAKDTETRESDNPWVIEKFVLETLDQLVRASYGRRPSLPVRVQQESLSARLRRFAQIQARERAEGWRIVEAEYRFETGDTLVLSGLPLHASLDRVEVHESTGRRRILDYKTFARDKPPEQTHLGSRAFEPLLPGEEVMWHGKFAYWKNLQLPLYRALAEYRWPGETPPSVGYFLLPERVEDSRIDEFPLDTFTFDAALLCAEALAERVSKGIFWPPRPVEYDDFAGIFLDQDPALILSEASVEFLQGEGTQ